MDGTQGKRLRGVPLDGVRRHAGWPSAWSAAVEAALAHGAMRPPEGVTWSDGERVQAVRREEVAASIEDLRQLGPAVAPGQMVLVLDEVLAPAPGRGRFHELRTACLLTADGRRDVSGIGVTFLHQVRAALGACLDRSLLVIADGAGWMRSFFRDHPAALPQSEMLLDGYHLARKCGDLGVRISPNRTRRSALLRRLLRALWAGNVERALTVLKDQRRHAADLQAVDNLSHYLQARAAWIPYYRERRRTCRSIGSGLAEKANDRILVRRQKRRGMQGGAQTSDALTLPCARSTLMRGGTTTGKSAASSTLPLPNRIPALLRAYQDHRGIKGRYRPMRGFGSVARATRFCAAYEEVRDFFRHRTTLHEVIPLRVQREQFCTRLTAVRALVSAA